MDAIELLLNADISGGNDIELALIGANGPKTVNFAVNPGTDLAITKTDNRTSAIPGESLTYTVVVSNNGPSDVSGAEIVDTLPSALTNVTYTSSVDGHGIGQYGPAAMATSMIRWTWHRAAPLPTRSRES